MLKSCAIFESSVIFIRLRSLSLITCIGSPIRAIAAAGASFAGGGLGSAGWGGRPPVGLSPARGGGRGGGGGWRGAPARLGGPPAFPGGRRPGWLFPSPPPSG